MNSFLNNGNTWPCGRHDKPNVCIKRLLSPDLFISSRPTLISDQRLLKFNLYPDMFLSLQFVSLLAYRRRVISFICLYRQRDRRKRDPIRHAEFCTLQFFTVSTPWSMIRKLPFLKETCFLELTLMEFALAIWTKRWKWLHCNRKCPLNFDLRSDTVFRISFQTPKHKEYT